VNARKSELFGIGKEDIRRNKQREISRVVGAFVKGTENGKRGAGTVGGRKEGRPQRLTKGCSAPSSCGGKSGSRVVF